MIIGIFGNYMRARAHTDTHTHKGKKTRNLLVIFFLLFLLKVIEYLFFLIELNYFTITLIN